MRMSDDRRRCPLKMMGWWANPEEMRTPDIDGYENCLCDREQCRWWRPATADHPADCVIVRLEMGLRGVSC